MQSIISWIVWELLGSIKMQSIISWEVWELLGVIKMESIISWIVWELLGSIKMQYIISWEIWELVGVIKMQSIISWEIWELVVVIKMQSIISREKWELLGWWSRLLIKWLACLPCKHKVMGLIPTVARNATVTFDIPANFCPFCPALLHDSWQDTPQCLDMVWPLTLAATTLQALSTAWSVQSSRWFRKFKQILKKKMYL